MVNGLNLSSKGAESVLNCFLAIEKEESFCRM